MKALIVEKPGVIRMTDVPKPKLRPKEVLSRVCYSGICATDMAILDGTLFSGQAGMVRYPVRIGHEWSGIVEEVGSEVQGFAPGDKVSGDDGVPCGECRYCLSGQYQYCPYMRAVGTIGDFWPGSFAEYILMPARLIFKLQQHADLKEAALIEPAGNAYNGLIKADIKIGDVVVIVGTGAIGLAAVGLAHTFGASKVILVGRRDTKLEIGARMGADAVINAAKEDITEVVKNQTWMRLGADAVLETSGNLDALMQSFSYLKPGGRLCVLGFYEKTIPDFNIDNFVVSGIEIRAAGGSAHAFDPIIRLMNERKVSFQPLISAVYPAGEYQQAFARVRENDDQKVKILLQFQED